MTSRLRRYTGPLPRDDRFSIDHQRPPIKATHLLRVATREESYRKPGVGAGREERGCSLHHRSPDQGKPGCATSSKSPRVGGDRPCVECRCYLCCDGIWVEGGKAMAIAEDDANGVILVTIQGGQTLDLAIALLGPMKNASAWASTHPQASWWANRPNHRPGLLPTISCSGDARRGATIDVEVAGGRPKDRTPFSLHVVGETGELCRVSLHGAIS